MSGQNNPVSIDRRRFLRSLAATAIGGLLTACALVQENGLPTDVQGAGFRNARLPSPKPDARSSTGQEDAELSRFLALSALLTGVDELDPALGVIYLNSLRESSRFRVTITELLDAAQAGAATLPETLDDLEGSGIFENESTRELADKISEYWYTGVYETAQGEQVVATFVEALAWRTLVFTKPMTICGSYRFWTEPPEAAID
jgi:hypothetical protein